MPLRMISRTERCTVCAGRSGGQPWRVSVMGEDVPKLDLSILLSQGNFWLAWLQCWYPKVFPIRSREGATTTKFHA